MTAEEYFNEHAYWNGTVLCNPIQLMESYHKHKTKRIKMICDTYEPWTDAESAISEIRTEIIK